MKYVISIFSFLIIAICINNAVAGDRYQLPKNIPTEVGVDAQYFEIASVQISPLSNDSLSLKFILAVFATEDAKKELGFGEYELRTSSETKNSFEQLIFPLLINSISKPD